MDLFSHAKRISPAIIEHRRALHRLAEAGLSLPKTTDYLARALKQLGIEPLPCGHSLIGVVGQGEKTLLLRADTDALPMTEKSGEPFSAEGDCAHTCGHDLHAAMLLGGAMLLKELEDRLPCRVLLLFQAGEEVLLGAQDALKAGLLERYRPARALALHVAPVAAVGQVFAGGRSAMMRSADRFSLTIRGKGGHGAYPNRAIDPLAAAVAVHDALSRLIAREADPTGGATLSVCSLHAGTAPNVIPDSATLSGALHVETAEERLRLRGRIETLIPAVCDAVQTECELIWTAAVPALSCDPDWTEQVIGLISSLPDLTVHRGMRAAASEDLAVIAERIPTTMLYLGAGIEGETAVAHDPAVRFNEEVLPIGAAILAHVATAWREEKEFFPNS